MSIKIMLLETADVFDINDINANPISQLEVGTEIEIDSIMKDWKMWRKITLPDGRFGLMSVKTKAKVLEYETLEAPKCGTWSNFKKVLLSNSPDQYGFDMPICIKEFEQDVKNLIQTSKKPEMVILACYHAGANWLLKEDVVTENVVNILKKKVLKEDLSAIESLIQIEQIQKTQIICDETIRMLVEKARKSYFQRETYFRYLIDIAKARQNKTLVDEILNIYLTTKYEYTYAGFRELHSITKDNRIIDFLITQLDQSFRLGVTSKIIDLTIKAFPQRWGPAFYAAEELLAIGDERGTSEIVPHLLEFLGEYSDRVDVFIYNENINEIADWHVRNRDSLNTNLNSLIPNLNEDSSYPNKKIHDYIKLFLEKLEAVEGNNG